MRNETCMFPIPEKKPVAGRVARPLFQVPSMSGGHRSGTPSGQQGGTGQESVEVQKGLADQSVKKVHPSHGKCSSAEANWMTHGSGGRERVSFGTNMSMEEDVSDDGAVD
jgi:hypothetical protein